MLRLFCLLVLLSTPASAHTIWVTHLTDDTNPANGSCNLREAILAANTNTTVDACPAGDPLNADDIFFAKTGTITLINTLPKVEFDTNIIGPGAALLTIDGSALGSVIEFEDTAGSPQFFTLSGVTITGGDAGDGGGIRALNVSGLLTVSDAVITGNIASGLGGGIRGGNLWLERVSITGNMAYSAGGIYSTGPSLVLLESTISGNTATGGAGGGLYTSVGSVTIRRSTLSGNSANLFGGGIYFQGTNGHTLDISHSTITNNTVGGTGGLGGGGLYAAITVDNNYDLKMQNNIVAGNFDLSGNNPDIHILSGATFTSFGYNLIGKNNGGSTYFPAGNPNANNDYVGTLAAPLVANINALQDNAGPTFTHPPTTTITPNTVIDKGSCLGQKHDQRGTAGNTSTPLRPKDIAAFADADDGCDIGANELGATGLASTFALKVLLDGAYTTGAMHTDLNTAGQIPLTQPYSAPPWNIPGNVSMTTIPPEMVDWVYVDFLQGGLMDAGGPSLKFRRIYALNANGSLFEPDVGFTAIKVDPGWYYVAVHHRNHLAVLSSHPVYVKWDEVVGSYDFGTGLAQAYTGGGTAMRDRGGWFTLWGGDGNASGGVTALDFLDTWLPINGGPLGYDGGDFNLSGSATALDFLTVWLPANGQQAQMP